MSQSDQIQYKKTSSILKNQTFSPVFSSNQYTNFKTYALENTITNTKLSYHQLKPSNKQIVFDMEKQTTNCPTFVLCRNTNARSNRRALTGCQIPARPSRPFTEKQRGLALSKMNMCLCSTMVDAS